MIGMGYLMGMSFDTVFWGYFLISNFFNSIYGKYLNDQIVESVTPLLLWERKIHYSKCLLELPDKEKINRVIEEQIREGI
jgi:hypothetical protein